MSKSDRLYFAYGANIDPVSMQYRCPAAQALGEFYLRDWRLTFYSHATVVPSPGDQVPGVLWRLTPECESSLDDFEGYPSYYTKTDIEQDGRRFFIYEMTQPLRGFPSSGYTQLIAQAYPHWGLKQTYLEQALNEWRSRGA